MPAVYVAKAKKGMLEKMKYILEKDDENYELMGGKATALSKIGKVIDNIPDWFVVSFKGFDINNKIIKEEAKLEIQERIENFSNEEYFAIRSSAGNEDSAENSFAGQFETFLYVKKSEIIRKNFRSISFCIFREN